MPKATPSQLKKINDKFSQIPLKEDQVHVFRTLAADTLPVFRRGWFSDYYIRMTDKMLKTLKKDYQKGTGLLASHDSSRLPFGRTFDAEMTMDDFQGENVNTLYIDHYMVTYVEDENGNKEPLKTEIGGMTTKDIANHIDVGHTFDTSIGFSINEPLCSVCNHALSDWDNCDHIPGFEYEVDGEMKRCDVMADTGEGIENSLVYAGAVDRATIQRASFSQDSDVSSAQLQGGVKHEDSTLYNVVDFKSLPKGADIFCQLSKGKMEVFTTTSERRDYKKYCEERESMTNAEQTPAVVEAESTSEVVEAQTEATEVVEAGVEATETVTEATEPEVTEQVETVEAGTTEEVVEAETNAEVSEATPEADVALSTDAQGEAVNFTAEHFNAVKLERDQALAKVAQLEGQVAELSTQAGLATQFTEDLIQMTLKAGIKARGNSFNADRFEKYLRALSVTEVKEELSALNNEFATAFQLSQTEVETERTEDVVPMSVEELRQEAAKVALARHKTQGGDLAELTKQAFEELKAKQN